MFMWIINIWVYNRTWYWSIVFSLDWSVCTDLQQHESDASLCDSFISPLVLLAVFVKNMCIVWSIWGGETPRVTCLNQLPDIWPFRKQFSCFAFAEFKPSIAWNKCELCACVDCSWQSSRIHVLMTAFDIFLPVYFNCSVTLSAIF